jgi:hypothetical protein
VVNRSLPSAGGDRSRQAVGRSRKQEQEQEQVLLP